MATNYKDIYRRNEPRKNIGCNPLYIDTYKPILETFSENEKNYNLLSSDFGLNGGNYEDNYIYLDSNEEDKIQLSCKDNKHLLENKGVKKMYDLNLKSLHSRKSNGEIKDVDLLHNIKILNSIDYNKTELLSTDKMTKRLLKSMNNKVVEGNGFKHLEDPFFSHPAHNKYIWKNSYFKKSKDKNIDGKWWDFKQNDIKPLNAKTVIDYRNKRPQKVNYDLIEYKN